MRARAVSTICRLGALAASFVSALSLHAQESGQSKTNTRAKIQAHARADLPAGAVPVTALAGQTIPVLPITFVVADSSLKHDSVYAVYRERAAALAAADSILGEALLERGPEVQWVLAPALRKLALRSPGMVKDPDELGQAILRSPRHKKEVPAGTLRAELRRLVAVTDGRVVLVPAALTFGRRAGNPAIHADVTLVLVDARAGTILWRDIASGHGPTPRAALDAALHVALPLESSSP